MMPASRPALSWSPPRVADTSCTSPGSNVSGSAPNLSTLARSVASDWLKFPEISALPLVITPLVLGADTDNPSRTIANRFLSPVSENSRRVTSANFFLPEPVKFRSTTQPPVARPWLFVCRVAVAPLTSVPRTSAGARMYFSTPSSLQVTSGFFGSSAPGVRKAERTFSTSPQSSERNFCCRAGVIPSAPVVVGAGVVAVAVGAGALADPVGVGLGVVAALTALRSALGTTALLVLVVGDGDGVPLVDGLGVAPPEAVGDGEALGTGVADPAPLTRTWRKRSSAVC